MKSVVPDVQATLMSLDRKSRLAIEIDGIGHDMGDRPQRDVRRDAWLAERGVTMMRIAAGDLMHRFDEIADAIIRMASELPAK